MIYLVLVAWYVYKQVRKGLFSHSPSIKAIVPTSLDTYMWFNHIRTPNELQKIRQESKRRSAKENHLLHRVVICVLILNWIKSMWRLLSTFSRKRTVLPMQKTGLAHCPWVRKDPHMLGYNYLSPRSPKLRACSQQEKLLQCNAGKQVHCNEQKDSQLIQPKS